jgi:CheY-like chemotaxis protein
MAEKRKILVVDDEQDLLEMYQQFLTQLASQPEVHTANSGARALALLESETFTLLLTDLNMPSMDGFQVITLVRRKYPSLRTVVMTSVMDEQFRGRAYAMGIDLYLEKPKNKDEIKRFVECVDSLLEREQQGGFRGIQSKSLVDIIQLECLSQSSCVLKITNGPLDARIWIQNGELIDSAVGELTGEDAFKKILGWKTGSFELLPADPTRTRTIFNSYQGLLLDSAQSMDEAEATESGAPPKDGSPATAPFNPLSTLSRFKGVEFVVSVDSADPKKFEKWGAESAEVLAEWTQKTAQAFKALGDRLKAGQLTQAEFLGTKRNLAVASRAEKELCVGFARTQSSDQIRESMKEIVVKWASF